MIWLIYNELDEWERRLNKNSKPLCWLFCFVYMVLQLLFTDNCKVRNVHVKVNLIKLVVFTDTHVRDRLSRFLNGVTFTWCFLKAQSRQMTNLNSDILEPAVINLHESDHVMWHWLPVWLQQRSARCSGWTAGRSAGRGGRRSADWPGIRRSASSWSGWVQTQTWGQF